MMTTGAATSTGVSASTNTNNSEMTAVQIYGQVLPQQHAWFILKSIIRVLLLFNKFY
jgi:hypothetical protein